MNNNITSELITNTDPKSAMINFANNCILKYLSIPKKYQNKMRIDDFYEDNPILNKLKNEIISLKNMLEFFSKKTNEEILSEEKTRLELKLSKLDGKIIQHVKNTKTLEMFNFIVDIKMKGKKRSLITAKNHLRDTITSYNYNKYNQKIADSYLYKMEKIRHKLENLNASLIKHKTIAKLYRKLNKRTAKYSTLLKNHTKEYKFYIEFMNIIDKYDYSTHKFEY